MIGHEKYERDLRRFKSSECKIIINVECKMTSESELMAPLQNNELNHYICTLHRGQFPIYRIMKILNLRDCRLYNMCTI